METGQKYTDLVSNTPTKINYSLSILIAQDGFSFFVKDQNGILFQTEKWLTNSLSIAEILKLLEQEFLPKIKDFREAIKQLKVTYANRLFTVVPTPYYTNLSAAQYLQYNTKILATDEVYTDTIKPLDLSLIFIPFTAINNFFIENFGDFNFNHLASNIIEKTHGIAKKNIAQDFTTTVTAFTDYFFLCIYQGDKLKLCNVYPYTSKEDFLYYTLFVFEQLSISPQEIPLQFLSPLNQESALYRLMYKYFVNVKLNKEITDTKNLETKQSFIHLYS